MKYIALLALILSACTSTKQATTESFETKASKALEEYKIACKSGKEIWGHDLCVPMIIVNRESMTSVATKQTPKKDFKKMDTTFTGKYSGPQLFANTSLQWEGETWSMVLWPLSDAKEDRIELLMHEAWHSIQNDIGLPLNSNFLTHLDKYDGRLLIRLEWNALLQALRDTDNQQKHLRSALSFRKIRFNKYPNAQNAEKILDYNEGFAAYTGMKFRSNKLNDLISNLENKLNKVEDVTSLTRSASYYTGPLYGLLLDSQPNEWKSEIGQSKGLGSLAQKKFRISTPKRPKLLPLASIPEYNYKSIDKFEKTRSKKKQAKIKSYLENISQKGGLELYPSQGSPQMFDPRTILVVGENDLIYVNYETNSDWGNLKVSDGVQVKEIKGKRALLLSKPTKITGNKITGTGWTLELNPQWKLESSKNKRSVLVKR